VGDFGDKVYFIAKGEAEVGGRPAPIKLQRGDIFGEAALVFQTSAAMRRCAPSRDGRGGGQPGGFQELLGNLPGLSANIEQIMSMRNGARRGPPERSGGRDVIDNQA